MKRILTSALASAALMLVFGVGVASADSISLNSGNKALSGSPGPYGNAVITFVDSTHADVTFTSLSGFLFGATASVDLNVNATAFTVSGITGTNSDSALFTPGPYTSSVAAGQEVDGWGKFNFTIDSFDGYQHSATSISFELTDTSGTWTSDTDVTTGNKDGLLAAAHIFVCDKDPCSPSGSATVTGFAAGNGTT